MTGDGVNDVLALKEARLGIAMGNGSQMAKGVADLILLTSSFATVPRAVEEGRRILRNTHRVAKLFVAKTVYSAIILATLGPGADRLPVPAAPDHGGLHAHHRRARPSSSPWRRRRGRCAARASCGACSRSWCPPGVVSAAHDHRHLPARARPARRAASTRAARRRCSPPPAWAWRSWSRSSAGPRGGACGRGCGGWCAVVRARCWWWGCRSPGCATTSPRCEPTAEVWAAVGACLVAGIAVPAGRAAHPVARPGGVRRPLSAQSSGAGRRTHEHRAGGG